MKPHYRFGNFEILASESSITIRDISKNVQIALSSSITIHRFLSIALTEIDEENDGILNFINSYIVSLFNVLCIVPDDIMLNEMFQVCDTAIKRHPELYGLDASEEDNDEIIDEMREMHELEEQIRSDRKKIQS